MGKLATAFFNAITAESFNHDSEVNSARKTEQCLRVSANGKQKSSRLASQREQRKELH